MNYRIGDVDIEHRRNFFSASPVRQREDYDREVDYRARHDRWERNVRTPRGTVYITYTNDLGDKISLSRLAVNMARQAEQKTEG